MIIEIEKVGGDNNKAEVGIITREISEAKTIDDILYYPAKENADFSVKDEVLTFIPGQVV